MENEKSEKQQVTMMDVVMAGYIFSVPVYKLNAILHYLGIEIQEGPSYADN